MKAVKTVQALEEINARVRKQNLKNNPIPKNQKVILRRRPVKSVDEEAEKPKRMLEVRTTYPYQTAKYFFVEGDLSWEIDHFVAMDYIREQYIPQAFRTDFFLLLWPKLKELIAQREEEQEERAAQ
jgi:hypothetical protein